MDPVDSIEALEEETDDSIEVSNEDIYSLTNASDDDDDNSVNVSDDDNSANVSNEDNDFSLVISYRDANISSNDDSDSSCGIWDKSCNWKIAYLDEERLKIRKEFEEADKFIPQIASVAYSGSHPEAVWTSRLFYFPDLADNLSKLTL
ncbi:19264_t:CDS:2 [Cetraspora pellucida]|uniref:19264_t:CDS:1 n=1 Tax=Cetraspora pellucida TaxID=1433469 RepID=A0A9N9DQU6_9GLOM|nr:19264_t:CDS:2 [Cetraspora pellucida]